MASAEIHSQPLAAESGTSDTDDFLTDDELSSYTASLSPSVTDYRYENGRRYHRYKEGKYFMPNDNAEQDRLDLHHHMLTLIQGGELCQAPLPKDPHNILDLGTGTGIWATDMADKYTSAVVLGNDLSPIQPSCVKFEVDDIESVWTFKKNHFDMIYARYLLGGITDYNRLMKQAYEHLKPGGYFEIFEPNSVLFTDDNTIPANSAFAKWNQTFIDIFTKAGRPVTAAPTHKAAMEAIGFVDVTEKIFKLPNAPWPKDKLLKEVGAYHLASFLEALEGLTMQAFTNMGGWSVEECQATMVNVRKDLRNKKIHTYYNLYAVYGRKPL